MTITSAAPTGGDLTPQQQRICAFNIKWLQEQREKPLKMPPLSSFKLPVTRQANYKPAPLKPTVAALASAPAVAPPPPREGLGGGGKVRAKRAEHVVSLLDGLLDIKPYPTNSAKPS